MSYSGRYRGTVSATSLRFMVARGGGDIVEGQFFDMVLFHLEACFYLFCAGQTKADPER